MIVQHLVNKDNGKLYKAVNNSVLLMWFESTKEWKRCCTKYEDLFNVDKYLEETFIDLSERQAQERINAN